MPFSYSSHLHKTFQEFSSRYPDTELHYDVFSGSTLSQVAKDYDLFFTPCVYHDLPDNIHRALTHHHSTYAILPPKHPLIQTSAIYLHQLAGHTIIVPYASEPFGPYAQKLAAGRKGSKRPGIHYQGGQPVYGAVLVSMGKGICIVPRYVKNMLPRGTFDVSISDRNCRFDEHLYYNETDNSAAKLFYEKYRQVLEKKL